MSSLRSDEKKMKSFTHLYKVQTPLLNRFYSASTLVLISYILRSNSSKGPIGCITGEILLVFDSPGEKSASLFDSTCVASLWVEDAHSSDLSEGCT
jgi:hypothetical protein